MFKVTLVKTIQLQVMSKMFISKMDCGNLTDLCNIGTSMVTIIFETGMITKHLFSILIIK